MNKVLLVEDQILFREGIKRVINDWENFTVIGEASNGREALDLCRIRVPDIVLMDISMPVMNGVEATRIIHKEFPLIRIVILTISDDDQYLFDAIKYGAQGYILKDTPPRRLHSQLLGIMEDEVALSGSITTKLVSEFRQADHMKGRYHLEDSNVNIESLTEREAEILHLIMDGHSNQEIAAILVISEPTVKKHLHNILEKLHLNNRVQAAVYAARSGLY